MPETLRFFLDPADFYSMLKEKNIDFYTGVPDSLLKDFCAYITDTAPKDRHVIAANEGAAVGLATGYYLATNKFPVVCRQSAFDRRSTFNSIGARVSELILFSLCLIRAVVCRCTCRTVVSETPSILCYLCVILRFIPFRCCC